MPAHHRRRDEHGERLPGMAAVVITTSLAATTFAIASRCLAVERFVLRCGVAALVLRIGGLEWQLRRTSRRGYDLFLHRGPHVVGLRPRAPEPAGRRDRLQARHARADHEHARGR